MKVISSIEEFISLQGEELGVSYWLTISQDMINLFADATIDHQWIHTDPRKAQIESPFGGTIAHGYLTLSLIPHFLDEIIKVENLDRIVNYGADKVVFKAAVKSGDKIRLSARLKSVKDLGNACLAIIACTIFSHEDKKCVMQGEIKLIYYFN